MAPRDLGADAVHRRGASRSRADAGRRHVAGHPDAAGRPIAAKSVGIAGGSVSVPVRVRHEQHDGAEESVGRDRRFSPGVPGRGAGRPGGEGEPGRCRSARAGSASSSVRTGAGLAHRRGARRSPRSDGGVRCVCVAASLGGIRPDDGGGDGARQADDRDRLLRQPRVHECRQQPARRFRDDAGAERGAVLSPRLPLGRAERPTCRDPDAVLLRRSDRRSRARITRPRCGSESPVPGRRRPANERSARGSRVRREDRPSAPVRAQ